MSLSWQDLPSCIAGKGENGVCPPTNTGRITLITAVTAQRFAKGNTQITSFVRSIESSSP